MGICWSSKPSDDRSPPATGELCSSTAPTTDTTLVSSGSSGFWGASPAQSPQMLPHPSLRIFTFAELRAATRNFRNDTVVGEGGFGKVYKGWLDSKSGSTVVAVKKLNPESLQGFEEWQVCLHRCEILFLFICQNRNSSPYLSSYMLLG